MLSLTQHTTLNRFELNLAANFFLHRQRRYASAHYREMRHKITKLVDALSGIHRPSDLNKYRLNVATSFWLNRKSWYPAVLLALHGGLEIFIIKLQQQSNAKGFELANALLDDDQSQTQNVVINLLGLVIAQQAIQVLCKILADYCEQQWWSWLSMNYTQKWLSDKSFFLHKFTNTPYQNPDQRILEDTKTLTSTLMKVFPKLIASFYGVLVFFPLTSLHNLYDEITEPSTTSKLPNAISLILCFAIYITSSWVINTIRNNSLFNLENIERSAGAEARFSLINVATDSRRIAISKAELQNEDYAISKIKIIARTQWDISLVKNAASFFCYIKQPILAGILYLLFSPAYFANQLSLGMIVKACLDFYHFFKFSSFFCRLPPFFLDFKLASHRLFSLEKTQEEVKSLPKISITESPDEGESTLLCLALAHKLKRYYKT